MLSCGECVKIELIKIEKLDSPETTYNFEVADFHTYYVSESKVLVHNRCVAEIKNDPHIDHGNITGSGKYGSYDITFNDGSHYIGKGSQSRMWQSASNHEIGSLKATAVKWRPATSGRQAFMKEALWMRNYRDYGVKLLNKIASPGFKFAGWFW